METWVIIVIVFVIVAVLIAIISITIKYMSSKSMSSTINSTSISTLPIYSIEEVKKMLRKNFPAIKKIDVLSDGMSHIYTNDNNLLCSISVHDTFYNLYHGANSKKYNTLKELQDAVQQLLN